MPVPYKKSIKKHVQVSQEIMDFIVTMRGYGVPISRMCCVSFLPDKTSVSQAIKKNPQFREDLLLVQQRVMTTGRKIGFRTKK